VTTDVDGQRVFRQAVASYPTDAGPAEVDEPPTGIDNGVALRVAGGLAIALGIFMFLDTRQLQVPVILIGAGVILAFYLASPHRLLREQVIDQWDHLIPSGQGRGGDIMLSTTDRIDSQGLPALTWDERHLAASRLHGGTRPFLVITQRANGRLRHYKMYVSARDYGTNLQVSWFLIYHRGFFERLKPNPLVQLTLFDEQDLRASVTAIHQTFLSGVLDVMLSLGQDTTKLNRSTKGFLGIS
jgi:hypothetical protein